MNHKQRAKQYLKKLHLRVFRYWSSDAEEEVDKFMHHLTKSIKDEIKKELALEHKYR